MATSAESGTKSGRFNKTTALFAGGAVVLAGGGFVAGRLAEASATSHGGGMVMDKCIDYDTTLKMQDGQTFELGVGDLSFSGPRLFDGYADAMSLTMFDGSLSVTDPSGGAEEFAGSEQHIIAAGHDMQFSENGANVMISLDETGGVKVSKTC